MHRKKELTFHPPSCFSYRSVHPEARGHLSEALTEDTGVGTSVAGSPLPLTTGNESLDITIVKHLQYCTQLVQVGCVVCGRRGACVPEKCTQCFSSAKEMRAQKQENVAALI